MSDPIAKITARRVDTDVAVSGAGPAGRALPGASQGSGWRRERTPEVVSDYPIVDLSTDALLTTTRSVRRCRRP
jgi:hypothetical protein